MMMRKVKNLKKKMSLKKLKKKAKMKFNQHAKNERKNVTS